MRLQKLAKLRVCTERQICSVSLAAFCTLPPYLQSLKCSHSPQTGGKGITRGGNYPNPRSIAAGWWLPPTDGKTASVLFPPRYHQKAKGEGGREQQQLSSWTAVCRHTDCFSSYSLSISFCGGSPSSSAVPNIHCLRWLPLSVSARSNVMRDYSYSQMVVYNFS